MFIGQNDLLICCIGPEENAWELRRRFREKFPQLNMYDTASFMDTLVKLSEYHYRTAVIVTAKGNMNGAPLIIGYLCAAGHPLGKIFIYRPDVLACEKEQFGVSAFAKGGEEELFAAAKYAARGGPSKHWLTRQELDEAEEKLEDIRRSWEERRNDRPPPPPKRLLARLFGSIARHWPFQR